MLFNSYEFALFLPVVFLLYWHIVNKNLHHQNLLIVGASYLFYGWWDWRFLALLVISSTVDYLIGKRLYSCNNRHHRKLLALCSLAVNLGLLGIFKYYNFFAESCVEALALFGYYPDIASVNVILPIGISFYTFQTLSYTLDIFLRKAEPARSAVAFFAYVSFFPQLVAGPIERAHNLLPQFDHAREFSYADAVDGLRQILLGLFKKIVVADNCAPHVDYIFENYDTLPGSTLLLGGVYFAFQIYGDFSGYSDIAIGTARLFGITLKRNFAYPYFSRSIAEFWRRWHISLSSWFRDYVYYPAGGSRCSMGKRVRNIFLIFLLSGFWHGANWTFLWWGLLNVVYMLPSILLGSNRAHTNTVAEGKLLPSLSDVIRMASTFFLVVAAWIFFRAESLTVALAYLMRLFSASLLTYPAIVSKKALLGIGLLVISEWVQRHKEHAFQFDSQRVPGIVRYALYYAVVMALLLLGGPQQTFIYFQF